MLSKIWRFLRLSTSVQLLIMRFFDDEFLVGVTGVFLDKQNRVLLFRHTYRGKWSLPGGYVKGKEHPKEGLEREVEEESNLTVHVEEPMKIRTDRSHARLDITYRGSFIGGDFEKSNEVKEAKLFEFDDLPRLPKDQLMFIDKAIRNNK